jgi:hypothetical protein
MQRHILVDERRYRRLRLLVRKLAQERKKQATKIDIVCNDLIGAQRAFIKRLETISFTANFYELIMGTTDLSGLLQVAGHVIRERMGDARVAFFLRGANSFELHVCEHERPITMGSESLEQLFTAELVGSICEANQICKLDDLYAMGLAGDPTKLNKISAATIPLGQLGSCLGFILVWRSSKAEFSGEQLRTVAAIGPGLSQAIRCCQSLLHSAK